MSYPILGFDPAPEALIEPSRIERVQDLPEHCVICFFREVLDKVIPEHDARVAVENRWEDGPHPIYEIARGGRRLAFFHPGVGGPIAAGLLEGSDCLWLPEVHCLRRLRRPGGICC